MNAKKLGNQCMLVAFVFAVFSGVVFAQVPNCPATYYVGDRCTVGSLCGSYTFCTNTPNCQVYGDIGNVCTDVKYKIPQDLQTCQGETGGGGCQESSGPKQLCTTNWPCRCILAAGDVIGCSGDTSGTSGPSVPANECPCEWF